MSSVKPISIALRGKHGMSVLSGVPTPTEEPAFKSTTATGVLRYSADGTTLVSVDPKVGVRVLAAETGETRCVIAREKVIEAEASPHGTFVLTWERPQQGTEPNLFVWNAHSGEKVFGYRQTNLTKENWPAFQWSDDEVIACKLTPGGVEVFDGSDLTKKVVGRIKLPGVARFKVSPGDAPYRIALFAKGKGGSPSSGRIYQFPDLDNPVCCKSFFRGDRADLDWNSQGTAVLVTTHTDVDKTGKSYYGETGVYYIQADGKSDYNLTLDKEGPIHDVKWSPLGGQFVVLYGFMPAKQTLFNAKDGTPVFEFGEGPRNAISWSPHGRFLALGGFGNLQGEVDFWDRNKLKKMDTVRIPDVVSYDWTPDSRNFVTAAVAPRLRVDNALRVYTYYGELLHHAPFDELYEVRIRPALPGSFPDRPQSPRLKEILRRKEEEKAVKAKEPVRQAYRHPNATKGAESSVFKRADRSEGRKVYVPPGARAAGGGARDASGNRLPPGAAPPSQPGRPGQQQRYSGPPGSAPPGAAPPGTQTKQGKNAAKNAKKKEKKKLEQEKEALKAKTLASLHGGAAAGAAGAAAEKANAGSNSSSKNAGSAANEQPATTDPAKRAKAINKKLRAIDDLKKKLKVGEDLLPEQREKLKCENSLRQELASLKL